MKRSTDTGRPIGDDHHRMKITDAEVAEMRDAYEIRKWTMNQIARACFREGCPYECVDPTHVRSFHTVRAILRYTRRNVQPRVD